MAEEFPRIRDNEFRYVSTCTVEPRVAGRLDLLCSQEFGTTEMYRVIAAANSITNPMALRATIRPAQESIYQELVLKGYTGLELERRYRDALEDTVIGEMDWHDYTNFADGCITEVYGGRKLLVPDVETGATWFSKYNTLQDE